LRPTFDFKFISHLSVLFICARMALFRVSVTLFRANMTRSCQFDFLNIVINMTLLFPWCLIDHCQFGSFYGGLDMFINKLIYIFGSFHLFWILSNLFHQLIGERLFFIFMFLIFTPTSLLKSQHRNLIH
jgi:hypothetical protein